MAGEEPQSAFVFGTGQSGFAVGADWSAGKAATAGKAFKFGTSDEQHPTAFNGKERHRQAGTGSSGPKPVSSGFQFSAGSLQSTQGNNHNSQSCYQRSSASTA